MPAIEQKSRIIVPFERKAATTKGEFEGHGSAFNVVDFGDDLIKPGAFTETLIDWKSRNQLPMMPWFHNMAEPIGEFTSMREDEKGLWVQGVLWVAGCPLEREPVERSKQVRNLLLSNGPKGMSIGFIPKKVSFENIDGVQVRVIEKVELLEVSIVPFGMNPDALVTDAKSLFQEDGAPPSKKDLEKHLRDAGFSRKQAKAFLADGYKALESETQRDAEPETVDFEFLESLARINSL